MYNISSFLELYRSLEVWAVSEYGEDGVKAIESYHPDRKIQNEIQYFRRVRNLLSHNPNGEGKPLIELTDEFKSRFELLCSNLMDDISHISIPYKHIYKREMGDNVVPTIALMKEKSFSYVPVMNGKKVWGVFSESAIFNLVGDGKFELINEETKFFNIGKYIAEYTKKGVFDFVKGTASIDDIRRIFSDASESGRRLDVLYVTSTGDQKGDLMGLITIWDIPNL